MLRFGRAALQASASPHVSVRRALESSRLGSQVTVGGWLRTVRTSKTASFAELSDGSCSQSLQVVMPPASAAGLSTGSAVRVTGTMEVGPHASQRSELQASHVELVGSAPLDYPLQKKRHTREYLRDIGHLRPRSRLMGSVMRVRDALMRSVQKYFEGREFLQVQTPIITSIDCEGAGDMFEVKAPGNEGYFGKPAFLTVSGQLQAEILACALSRVYTVGPTFRAENSHTPRHLAEFWMLEAEQAFLSDLSSLTDLIGGVYCAAIDGVLETNSDDISFLQSQSSSLSSSSSPTPVLRPLRASSFPTLTYTEAVSILSRATGRTFQFPPRWGDALHLEHEQYLTDHVGGPLFVVDYPRDVKSFYMRQNDCTEGRETVAAVDFLVPGIGELAGGSLREERLDVLAGEMGRRGMDTAQYEWYLDLRRHGTVPHGGFGMGFERLVMAVSGIENVRDALPFPRHAGRCLF